MVDNRGACFALVAEHGDHEGMGAAVEALRQGEALQYTELLEDSRRHAIDRMADDAQRVRRRYRGWAQRLTGLSPWLGAPGRMLVTRLLLWTAAAGARDRDDQA